MFINHLITIWNTSETVGADLAVDTFLHAILDDQHIEGLIQHPHHHGCRVQRARLLPRAALIKYSDFSYFIFYFNTKAECSRSVVHTFNRPQTDLR